MSRILTGVDDMKIHDVLDNQLDSDKYRIEKYKYADDDDVRI